VRTDAHFGQAEPPAAPDHVRAVLTLVLVLVLGWIGLIAAMVEGTGHDSAVPGPAFLAMWITMSVAMMLPTIAPLVLARANERGWRGVAYASGYLVLWTATAPVAFVAMQPLHSSAWLLAGAWVVAGLWQGAPWTAAALGRCQREAPYQQGSALIAGLRQGLWCAIACLPLMVVGMATAEQLPAIPGVALMILLTILMVWEKSLARSTATQLLRGRLRLSAVLVFAIALLPIASVAWPAGQLHDSDEHAHHTQHSQ